MTKNTTNKYRIPADQIQTLEIDRNGRVAPRLHDLEPLKNTLLSVLYPGIKVASVNVPTEILDEGSEAPPGLGCAVVVEADETAVGWCVAPQAGRLEQRCGAACIGNELAVRVRVRDEVSCRRAGGKRGGAVGRRDDGDGVEEDRRGSGELLSRENASVAGVRAAGRGRDDLQVRLLVRRG